MTPMQMFPQLAIVSHAAYDSAPVGVRDSRRVRCEPWRAIVLDQHEHDTVGGGE